MSIRYPEKHVECPHCGDTFCPFGGGVADPHEQLDELLDESVATELECDGCGKTFYAFAEPIWRWRTEVNEDGV